MTDPKIALINRIFRKVFDHTESWDIDHIGTELAYLIWAIAENEKVDNVDWASERCAPILRLFERLFDPDDMVWDFITRRAPSHFIVRGRIPEDENLTLHVEARDAQAATTEFTNRLYAMAGLPLPAGWPAEDIDEAGGPLSIIDCLAEISAPPIKIHDND